MDYVTGGGLIVLGLLILVFGRSAAARTTVNGAPIGRWRQRLNNALTWAVGLVCIWFGVATIIQGKIVF